MISLEQAEKLIKLARQSIESHFSGKEVSTEFKEEFSEKRGVFVTLTINKELRGCIGYIEAVVPLWQAVIDAARNAGFSDPRFGPLSKEEYEKVDVEVSVLTVPKLVEGDYLQKVKVGRDGLIVEKGMNKGLLLPQVPVEWKWDVRQFLNHTCMKAGLAPSAWESGECKIYSFQCQVFSEEDGKIVQKM